MNYKNLFEQSTIAAQIVDNHQNVHFSSANAAPLDSVVLEKAKLAPVRLNNTLLHAQPLSGGYVYWQDDLKAINELTKHLQEANEILSENYDLMKAEVELKERRLHVVEKTRLYDRIAHEIMPQLNKADALLEQSRQQPERAKELLSQVCVLSAYIKRRANLILVGEEKETIPAKELQSCLHESLDNMRLCGILTYLDFHCDGQAGTRQIIALYDLFEAAIDLLLNHLSAAMVTAEQAGSTLQLRIQLGCKDSIPELPAWTLPGGAVTCEMQERDLILTAKIDLGGESA